MLLLTACGYHLGYQPRPGLRSIAIPIAENLSLRRELEFPLTQAIVREVQRRTPLIVRPRGDADATLAVTISRFEEAVLVEGPNFNVLEKTGAIYLDVVVTSRDGTPLVGKAAAPVRLVETAEFPVSSQTDVATITPDAFRELAERVVMLLEAPIGTPPPGAAPRSRAR